MDIINEKTHAEETQDKKTNAEEICVEKTQDKNRTRGIRRAQKALISAEIKRKIALEVQRIHAEITNNIYPRLVANGYYQERIDDLTRRYHKNEGRSGRHCYECGPNGACDWCIESWYAKVVRLNDAFDLERAEWEEDILGTTYNIADMDEDDGWWYGWWDGGPILPSGEDIVVNMESALTSLRTQDSKDAQI